MHMIHALVDMMVLRLWNLYNGNCWVVLLSLTKQPIVWRANLKVQRQTIFWNHNSLFSRSIWHLFQLWEMGASTKLINLPMETKRLAEIMIGLLDYFNQLDPPSLIASCNITELKITNSTTLSSLVEPQVVIMTAYGATSDNKVVKLTIVDFHRWKGSCTEKYSNLEKGLKHEIHIFISIINHHWDGEGSPKSICCVIEILST